MINKHLLGTEYIIIVSSAGNIEKNKTMEPSYMGHVRGGAPTDCRAMSPVLREHEIGSDLFCLRGHGKVTQRKCCDLKDGWDLVG